METPPSNQVFFFALLFVHDVIVCNCFTSTGDQIAVARYICRKYHHAFPKLKTAQVYVSRVMQRVKMQCKMVTVVQPRD